MVRMGARGLGEVRRGTARFGKAGQGWLRRGQVWHGEDYDDIMAKRRGRRGRGGLIQRPNGRWQAQVSRTEGGKRTRVTKTFAMKSDAEWWLKEARRGSVPDVPTIAEYLDRWLAGKRKIRESTRALYESHIRVHLKPALGGFMVTELRPRHVEAFVSGLTVKPGTAALILRTLKGALADGVRRHEIPENAAEHVEPPEVRRDPVEPMTEEEASALIQAVRGTWLEYVVRFLLGTGCRIGEACALNQEDVGDGYVLIRRAKTVPRATLVSEDGMEALRQAIHQAPRRGPKEPVFYGPHGDRLRRDTASHVLPRLLTKSGLTRRSPHKLRHGAATLMVAAGVHSKVIAEQLGNTERVVNSTYAHVIPRVARQAIGVLDQAARKR